MKKFYLLALIGLFVVALSLNALADDPLAGLMEGYNSLEGSELNGIKAHSWISNNVNVEMDRTGYYFDNNIGSPEGGDQVAEISIPVQAYIPCYLELELTGNQGDAYAKSFGPNAYAEESVGGFLMAFDNEIGGFVNEDWDSIGHGRNAEIEPAEGTYIQACDVFKVNVYSNDAYRYQVESAPLVSANADISGDNSDDTLDLQMRTSLDGAAFGGTVSFSDSAVQVITEKAACDETEAYHQFRVPYTRNTAHGRYNGTVTFKAYNL